MKEQSSAKLRLLPSSLTSLLHPVRCRTLSLSCSEMCTVYEVCRGGREHVLLEKHSQHALFNLPPDLRRVPKHPQCRNPIHIPAPYKSKRPQHTRDITKTSIDYSNYGPNSNKVGCMQLAAFRNFSSMDSRVDHSCLNRNRIQDCTSPPLPAPGRIDVRSCFESISGDILCSWQRPETCRVGNRLQELTSAIVICKEVCDGSQQLHDNSR